MTNVSADSLRVLPTEESCERLPGLLWQTFFRAGAWALFAISLAWLIQAAELAAPPAVWWKSLVALGCLLAFTYLLRVSRRLDAHAKQGWSLTDIALFLAGSLLTAVFVMRGGVWIGAAIITLFIAFEGLSLWRLKLLPMQIGDALNNRLGRRSQNSSPPNEVIPTRSLAEEELSATPLASHGESEADVSQQFTRRETEEGPEISGFLRGRFEPNELLSSVDIAFCPTLPSTPTLEFETICDEEIDVHVATLRPYGARLDLKRKGGAGEPLDFTLEIHVACNANDDADSKHELAIHEPADS